VFVSFALDIESFDADANTATHHPPSESLRIAIDPLDIRLDAN